MGQTGYRALLSRALSLASAEVPWMRGVTVRPEGTLEGLADVEAKRGPAEVLEARVLLMTNVIGLLVAFIGEDLTLRLLGDVWPKLVLDDHDSAVGVEER
jgi:hypothetical protein